MTITENHYSPSEKAKDPAEETHPWPAPWWSPFWSNWALVIVGLGAAGAAVWTLRAVKDQAKAIHEQNEHIRKQVAIQEAMMRQWVELKNWRWTKVVRETGEHRLDVLIEIENPTNWPITLDGVRIQVGGDSKASTEGVVNLLPPKTSHTSSFQYKLDSATTLLEFRASTLVLQVDVDMVYRTALDKKRGQKIRTLLYGGEKGIATVEQWKNTEYDSTPSTELED